jgi:amidase
MPTVPDAAPRLDLSYEDLDAWRNRALSMLCLSGLSGLPQMTMPLGEVDGCPIGLSLLGPRGTDRALVALAARISGA